MRSILVVGIGLTVLGQNSYCYQRFTYVNHNFNLATQDSSTLLDDLVYRTITCNKRSVTYSVEHTMSRRDFVYLSRLDKWRIVRVLSLYDRTLVLTPEVIQDIVASLAGKRKIIIQHVLNDFLKNPESTIASVLQVLQDHRVG